MAAKRQSIPTTIVSGALMLFAFSAASQAAEEGTEAAASAVAPQFSVDPDWPKPLPNNWQVGQVAGISVGPDDNIYVLHRPRSLSSSQTGATDAEPGVYVCNAQGELVERGTTCRSTDEFEEATAADAFGHPRPYGPISDNAIPAPAVLKFDQEGNLLEAWGGPRHHGEDWGWPDPLWTSAPGADCQWPANEHGLHVDDDGHVYIGANGEGDGTTGVALNDRGWDGHVLKFTADGECQLQVGEPLGPGRPDKLADSNDTDSGVNGTPQLFRAANMHVHGDNLYIADGYGNRRVVVVDKETGQYRRHWGAYGDVTVDDTAPGPFAEERPVTANRPSQFRTPVHCVRVADDNERIYVCDRVNNRIQVFDQSVGTDERCTDPSQQMNNECGFLFEKFVRANTLGPGSVWDLALSSDRAQSCVHQADGSNQRLYTLHRPTLNILDSFGESGRQAGAFHWLHDVAADSHGNLYTTEVDTGKRAQRFERVGRRNCRAEAAEG